MESITTVLVETVMEHPATCAPVRVWTAGVGHTESSAMNSTATSLPSKERGFF